MLDILIIYVSEGIVKKYKNINLASIVVLSVHPKDVNRPSQIEPGMI